MSLTRKKKSGEDEAKQSRKEKALKAPTGPFTPTGAQVNLLPAEVVELVAVQALKRRLVIVAVAMIGLFAALYVGQFARITAANNDLAEANAKSATLSRQLADLASVKRFYADVENNQKTIMTTMQNEVLYSKVLSSLTKVTPNGIRLTNVNIASVGATAPGEAAGTPCPGPDPFNPVASVGCVTITGTASSRDAIGTFLTNVDRDDFFASPYVSATTADDKGQVSFSATVGLTDRVYPHRYNDVLFLRGETK